MGAKPFIKYSKKREIWNITRGSFVICLGDKKNAINLFSGMLKIYKKKDKEKNHRIFIMKGIGYELKLIWSRTTKSFFIELYVGEIQVGAFPFRITNFDIIRQCKYFQRHSTKNTAVFDKLILLYGKE